jgi:hypothetical protein
MSSKTTINFFLITILLSFSIELTAQDFNYNKYGKLYRLSLSSSMFPHDERKDGHTYGEEFYSFEEHYNDSTTLVFVPNHVSLEEEFDVVLFFHGWWNNVDSSLVNFHLAEQLYESRRNAILVLPEGPKNSADSFGGKLEESGQFKKLIEEVLSSLPTSTIKHSESFNYILAGHSGAGRVMAYILMHGGLTEQIKEVYLFDGLYEQVEKYTYWLDNYKGRFINIYTPNAGTKYLSENLMVSLNAWNIPFKHISSDEFKDDVLRNGRIIIIESQLGHNEVISSQNQFRRFLETGK